MNENIKKAVDCMKAMSDELIQYTFPKVSFEEEHKVLCLKQRVVCFDGYEVILCYSKADYKQYMLETLQIQSLKTSFLPFNVICKIGKLFMGKDNLSYIDFFRNNNKVYCWVIKSFENKKLLPGKRSRLTNYEGFKFYLLHPKSVDLL